MITYRRDVGDERRQWINTVDDKIERREMGISGDYKKGTVETEWTESGEKKIRRGRGGGIYRENE